MMRILDNLNRCLLITTIAIVGVWISWSYSDEMLLIGSSVTIWAVNPDGTALRTVREGARPLVVSPDGQWIIVEKPNGDKEVVDLESGRVLVSLGRFVGDLSWSPDSEWIAFQQFGGVFVARRDGSDEKRLADGMAPKWDPFNPHLIYYTIVLGLDGYDLGLVDIRSGESRVVRPGMHLLNVASPFSPDGSRLLVSDCVDGTSCIKILDIATGEVTGPIGPSGRNGVDANSPSWSPDGTQLAFSVADGRGGLHVAEVAGQGTRQLVPGGGDAVPRGPVWSPTGDAIAFCLRDLTGIGSYEIYVIHLDGTGMRKVTDGGRVLGWWTVSGEEQPTPIRLETWGIIKQDSR